MIGIVIALILLLITALVAIFLWDIFQKKHSILRTYPLVGHLRYFAEGLGIYLRQYFYSNDREELPFNRTQRTWVYEASKDVDTTIGFGSTRNLKEVGAVSFVSAAFPVLNRDSVKTKPITIGPHTRFPYSATSIINISAMSYGAISTQAIRALGAGAKMAGCWMNTGEGGVSPYHLESGCDLIAQIGTAKYGYRDEAGNLSEERLKEVAAYPQVKMFEIKLSQGAKPGKGGVLPAVKVTEEIAAIRKIPAHEDSISPNRFVEISNSAELLDFIHRVREITGKPTGFKTVLGDVAFLNELCDEISARGVASAPDFITLDGAEGGTGAAPETLAGYVGLPISESLPALVDTLIQYGLRDRIKVIASGKLITPEKAAWALCIGADFINSARGFMFSLGCIQALRCHKNTCPTGITTHNPWLIRGLDPQDKSVRVFHYVKNFEYEIGMIGHSCGVSEPRELGRHHVRIVSSNHETSIPLSEIFPDQKNRADVSQ